MESAARTVENLQSLLAELADYNACRRLKGRLLPLSSGSSPVVGGRKPDTGVLRIDACNIRKVDPRHLRIDLSGPGWEWISRKKERLGATFAVDDNVRFQVNISMTGTFDLAYVPEAHILTIWFVPTEPVNTNLNVLGNVDIDTVSLWADIIGTAGTLLGQPPEKSAQKEIKSKGARMFQSRLSHGFSLIVDMCTGRHYVKLGAFPAGELPGNATSSYERVYLVDSSGLLHTNSLLLSGPFDVKNQIIAQFRILEGGAISASIVCEDDAVKIADAYVNKKPLPGIKPLVKEIIQPGNPVSMKARAHKGCKVVLVMGPVGEQKNPVSFTYAAYQEGDRPKALVNCARE